MTDKKLISSLQGLRAVAFLCVVLSHCGAPWLGPWAISVFVALSGFLMVCNYYDRPRTAPGLQSAIAFSFKKIRRLYTPAQNFDGFWLRLDFQRNIYSQQESLQRAFCTEP